MQRFYLANEVKVTPDNIMSSNNLVTLECAIVRLDFGLGGIS